MPDLAPWRLILPALAALAMAFWVEERCRRMGILPPGLRILWRRVIAGAALAALLFRGVFLPLALWGLPVPEQVTEVPVPQLFLLQIWMLATLAIWFAAGFAGLPRVRPEPVPEEVSNPDLVPPPPPPPVSWARKVAAQLGLLHPNVPREIGVGLVLGVGAWIGVLAAALALGLSMYFLGGQDSLPKSPPAVLPWIAGLPLVLRLLLSLSAGLAEELFFRGFLQPRVGIVLSTLCFSLAHLSYGQPFLLFGVTLLSLIYGLLVRWRQNLWPAIAAHALFDAIQLLIVIPSALKLLRASR